MLYPEYEEKKKRYLKNQNRIKDVTTHQTRQSYIYSEVHID